jgi:hypothetical protein
MIWNARIDGNDGAAVKAPLRLKANHPNSVPTPKSAKRRYAQVQKLLSQVPNKERDKQPACNHWPLARLFEG